MGEVVTEPVEQVENKEPQVEEPTNIETTKETEKVEKEQKESIKAEKTEPEVKDLEPETEPTKDADKKDEPEDAVDVDELLENIKGKEDQISTLKTQIKKEQGKVEQLKDKVKTLESVVSGLVETKLKELPENLHALVPEGDSVAKLAWLNKAEESGIFNKQTKAPNVEIGKPMTLGNPNEKAESNLTAQQKLSNYFSNYFKK